MEAVAESFRVVSPALAAALIASVWQGLLLTAAVGTVMCGARAVSPAARSWVWRAVLVLLLLLPVLALLVPHPRSAGQHGLHAGQGWSAVLLGLWAVCSAGRGFALANDAVRLRKLTARAVPVAVGGELGALLAGPRGTKLCVSAEVNRPCVTGLLHPCVLLPQGLLETLSLAELDQVVRHETEHLRRGDDWFNLLQGIGLVLLPLNPALLWLDRQLGRERELACDDAVLRATASGRAYAACLVKLAEDSMERRGLALALSALGTRARESELVSRVRRILAGPDRAAAGLPARLILGGLMVGAVAGAVALAGSPQWVSFDASSSVAAQAAAPPGIEPGGSIAGAGQIAPVSAVVRGEGRPALMSAAMRLPGLMRPQAAAHGLRRRIRVRLAPVGTRVPVETSWGSLPGVTAPGVPASGAAVQAEDVPAARFVVTEFELSQPVYAAVPWGGGWLILQL